MDAQQRFISVTVSVHAGGADGVHADRYRALPRPNMEPRGICSPDQRTPTDWIRWSYPGQTLYEDTKAAE